MINLIFHTPETPLLNLRAMGDGLSVACLSEMVLLGCLTATVQAFRKVIISLPSGAPLINAHNLVPVANRRIDLDRVTLLYLAPFPRVYPGFRGRIDFRVDVRSQVCVVFEVCCCFLHCVCASTLQRPLKSAHALHRVAASLCTRARDSMYCDSPRVTRVGAFFAYSSPSEDSI